MATGPKQRPNTTPRGGARAGAGRKPVYGVSDAELKKLFRALKAEAKARGESWQDNFAQHLYSDDWREAAAFHRMLTDQIKVRRSESHVTTKNQESPVTLPEIRPDPGKVVPLKSAG